MSASAIRDPKWLTETLSLKIGAGTYEFKSLSLYSVWVLWPHLRAVKAALLAGRPLTMMKHATEILKWICPALVANEADCKEFQEIHANLALDFYRSQDFARMETFGESTTKADAVADEQTEEEKHQTFVAVCAAAAQYAGMDVGAFVQQRFEFCADQIIAAHKSLTTSGKPATSSWTAVLAEVSASMAGANVKIDPEKKPDWMKAIEGEPN
jgi:hypothetical protein